MSSSEQTPSAIENGSGSGTAAGQESSSHRLPKILPFHELCRCGDEVWIENEGTIYRLRRTRQGKLILTK